MAAWTTTVGRLRWRPPAWPAPGAVPGAGAAPGFVRLPIASAWQTETKASAIRWSKGVRSRRRRLARAISELFTTAYWSSGSVPVRVRRRSSKRRNRRAIEAGRAFLGLIPSSQGKLADLLGGPVRRLFGELGVGLGLGDFDERLHLVEGELSSRQRIGDLGQRWELGGCGDPFSCGGGGDAASLDEPGHHRRGTVDSPRPPLVQFGHGLEELTLVRRDRPVMLGDARHQGVGSPRHRGGAGSVFHEGGCHADLNGRRMTPRTTESARSAARPLAARSPVRPSPARLGRRAQRYRSAGTHSPWLRTGSRAGRWMTASGRVRPRAEASRT